MQYTALLLALMRFYVMVQLRLERFKIFLQVVRADGFFCCFAQREWCFAEVTIQLRVFCFNQRGQLNDFLHEFTECLHERLCCFTQI